MTNKEIIQTYRKIKKMGFSKLEAKEIYKQNTTLPERYLKSYSILNEALEKIQSQKSDKKTLMNKINKECHKIRLENETEFRKKNPIYLFNDFSII